MDPRKQECFSHYLYGAGYFARDENTLGILTGRGMSGSSTHFCASCPAVDRCEREQRKRVAQENPKGSERYEEEFLAAKRRGLGETLPAILLAKRGLNPYFADAMASFSRGHADRGRISGPLVAPKAEGDVG